MERITQRFWRDMWQSVVPEAVNEAGIEVKQFGPVQATAFSELPEAGLLNQVRGAAEPGAVEGGHLAAAVEWLRSREVDFRISVAAIRPGAAGAMDWLENRGYEREDGWVKYVRDGRPPQTPENPDLVIYELGQDEADGEGLSAIAAQALELPITVGTLFFSLPQVAAWKCYTAALGPGETAVATGAMLVEAGIAQLGPGTTLRRARGKGCNTALLRRRVLDAGAAACHTVFVELYRADAEEFARSERILLREGFELAYESPIWRRPAPQPAEVG
ncbi:MAG TPA: hypothetical protein VHI77_04595 [Solirubrobacterales bacterium]|nr:hypothetical protein [Solirubrobacterales bacterium]